MSLVEALDAFLQDFGVAISFSGSPAGMLGIEDLPELELLGDGDRAVVAGIKRSVLIRTTQKGTLARGSAITVNGVARLVANMGVPVELADGAFTLVTLRDP